MDTEFWFDCYFLSALKKCVTSFWIPWFLLRKLIISMIFSLCMIHCFSLSTFKKFLSLVFSSLIAMCFSLCFFGLIYLRFTPLVEFIELCLLPIFKDFNHYFFTLFSVLHFSHPLTGGTGTSYVTKVRAF